MGRSTMNSLRLLIVHDKLMIRAGIRSGRSQENAELRRNRGDSLASSDHRR